MDDIEKEALGCRKALVRVNGVDAGYLEMVATDEFKFSYLESYLRGFSNQPISLTMDLRKEPYISEKLLPFFDNLLFEGDQLRLAEKQFHLNRYSMVDRFKLLMLTGKTLLSPVSIHPLAEGDLIDLPHGFSEYRLNQLTIESPYSKRCSICMQECSGLGHQSCLRKLWGVQRKCVKLEAFAEEPINIFKTLVPGQSLSGAQKKALFSLSKQGILSRLGKPSHILKPDGEFPQMPANEHLTMTIAGKLGFPTPPNALIRIKEIGYIFVTKRFDEGKEDQKLAFEDMAQLLEEIADCKDEATMEAVAGAIKKFSTSPKIELADFFRRLVFCFVIGNGDMHLKNWGLRYGFTPHLIKLSPIYDWLNVRCSFPQELVEMILSLNQKQKDLSRSDFEKFANDCLGLSKQFITKTLQELYRWQDIIEEYNSYSALTPDYQERYIKIVKDRIARLK